MRDIFAIPAALTEATMDPMYEFMDLSNQGLLAAAACIEVDDESILTPSQKVAGRNSFIDNIRNIKKDYETNWHHEGVASALEKVQTGEITRLIILEPPRHGKSEQVSRHFPAWCFGKNPDEKIIACSYDATLAAMMGLDVQRNMTTPEYKDMFDTRLASGNKDGTKHKVKETEKYFEIANGDGYYIGAGIGGPITGKGMTIGIIDDPFKNKEEAQSKVIRDKVWNWYNSTFRTRGEGKASLGGDERIIICLTPWHEDGLEGRILKQAEETGEKWVVVRCEAVREDDAANDSVYKSTPGIIDEARTD